MFKRRLPRHQFLHDVAANQRRIALKWVSPATAAAGAHDRFRHDRHWDMRADHRLEVVLAGQPQQVAAGLTRLAAPQSPGRTVAPARLFEVPAPLDQVAYMHVDAESAAILAGAAGVAPQRAAFDQHRALELDALDRAVAHVALADRHGRGLAILERSATPAAAFDALHHEAALSLWVHAEEYDRAAEEPMVTGRHLGAHRRRQRLHDGVHHRGHDDAPARHRRRKARHHDVAFRDDDLECAERASVDGLERAGQRLIGDAGARKRARVDAGAALGRAAREVDGHLAFCDCDLDADWHGLALEDAVVIHRRFGLIDAVGKLRHHVAALGLGLIEDAIDRRENGGLAVLVEQLVHAACRQPTGGHLRFHVAERGLGKTDVVLEHAVERLVKLALLVDL